ncbi:hypothetical protein L873DRAFT_1840411 [Choiromyces venosus 120613-1]|uniref:Uncharacterized protein n=1 Tax=Choiromyces venosus 120613-1 TaxID=1336337 RepID=A0A3N4K258_9PEZI|nr:hypothetical protein L873DRAFT_1840411 [Choiromyces venosus 120613-1]
MGNSIQHHRSSHDQYEHQYLFSVHSVIIANEMASVKALLCRDIGKLAVLTSTVTLAATSAVIWDNQRGLNHAANNLDTKFDGVKADISCLEADIGGVKSDINRIEKKLEDCQWIIGVNGHYTMHALDGDKTLMRQWFQRHESCK